MFGSNFWTHLNLETGHVSTWWENLTVISIPKWFFVEVLVSWHFSFINIYELETQVYSGCVSVLDIFPSRKRDFIWNRLQNSFGFFKFWDVAPCQGSSIIYIYIYLFLHTVSRNTFHMATMILLANAQISWIYFWSCKIWRFELKLYHCFKYSLLPNPLGAQTAVEAACVFGKLMMKVPPRLRPGLVATCFHFFMVQKPIGFNSCLSWCMSWPSRTYNLKLV